MKWLIFAVILILLVADVLLIEPNFVRTTKLELSSSKIPAEFNGFKIALISDLHLKGNGIRESQAIASIQTNKPDLLIISGDFCETKEMLPELRVFLTRLRDKYSGEIITTLGNWDFWMGDLDSLTNILNEFDITLLRNNSIYIEKEGSFINIVGVDDPYTGHDDISYAMRRVNTDNYTVLVAHAPDIVNHLEEGMYFDVILTGHTHGGQVLLPFISSKFAPTNTSYLRGMYDTEFGKLYVNRGIGTTTLPIRFLSPPEVTVFTLNNQ